MVKRTSAKKAFIIECEERVVRTSIISIRDVFGHDRIVGLVKECQDPSWKNEKDASENGGIASVRPPKPIELVEGGRGARGMGNSDLLDALLVFEQ